MMKITAEVAANTQHSLLVLSTVLGAVISLNVTTTTRSMSYDHSYFTGEKREVRNLEISQKAC